MMQELFAQPYFGVLLTIAAYWAGMKIQHKTRLAICNGMLLAVLLVIAVLLVFHIPYESYYQGGALINLFLGPATACMAVTIYSQRRLLAKHWLPVLVGCTVAWLQTFRALEYEPRALLVAQQLSSKGQDQAFMQAKIATARFYAEHILVKAPAQRDAIVEGAASVTALALDAF